jgi:hypothetical protein
MAVMTVLTGIMVVVLGGLALTAAQKVRISRAPLSGIWDQIIPEGAKHDLVDCRNRGRFVSGTIARVASEQGDEDHWRWGFKGVATGVGIFIAYWPTNEIGTRGSYGSVCLTAIDPDKLSGFYVKNLTEEHGVIEKVSRLVETELTWTRRSR